MDFDLCPRGEDWMYKSVLIFSLLKISSLYFQG